MWEIITQYFEAELSSASLLELSMMKKADRETYCQFLERIFDHVRHHLTPPNRMVDGVQSGTRGDEMTISMYNVLVITWLEKIDKRLICRSANLQQICKTIRTDKICRSTNM